MRDDSRKVFVLIEAHTPRFSFSTMSREPGGWRVHEIRPEVYGSRFVLLPDTHSMVLRVSEDAAAAWKPGTVLSASDTRGAEIVHAQAATAPSYEMGVELDLILKMLPDPRFSDADRVLMRREADRIAAALAPYQTAAE